MASALASPRPSIRMRGPWSKHLRPTERRSGKPFIASAPAEVDYRNGTFKQRPRRSRRWGTSESPFPRCCPLCLSVAVHSPMRSTQAPLSATQRRDRGDAAAARGHRESMRRERNFRNEAHNDIRNDHLGELPTHKYNTNGLPNIDILLCLLGIGRQRSP